MNRIAVKTGAALLTGLVLALPTGSPVKAGDPDEGASPPAEATAPQEVYYLYGLAVTRAGDRYTYLGAYASAEDADAVRKAACHSQDGEGPFPEYRVVQSAGLALPPSAPAGPPITILRLSAFRRCLPVVGRYDTEREATAAAEKVLAEGDRFVVVYQ
jgi:hypothetical protein